jgi:hypothetical protein
MGDTPFATVTLVAVSRAFGGAVVGDGDDVVLLSSLRRLSGGFAEKDMKKKKKKESEKGQEWLMNWAHWRQSSGPWSFKYPLSR